MCRSAATFAVKQLGVQPELLEVDALEAAVVSARQVAAAVLVYHECPDLLRSGRSAHDGRALENRRSSPVADVRANGRLDGATVRLCTMNMQAKAMWIVWRSPLE